MKRNKICLSADEIIILAGLLNYHCILAVDDRIFYEINDAGSDRIRTVVETFEKNSIIYYDFGGELRVVEDYKRIIDTICNPKYVIVFDGTLGSGKRKTVYQAVQSDIVLFQKTKKCTYEFELYSIDESENCIKKNLNWNESSDSDLEKKSGEIDFHEKLQENDAKKLQESMLSFQEKDVIDYLEQKLSDGNAMRPIMGFLSGQCRYMRIQVLTGDGNAYQNTYDALIAESNGKKMKVTLDRNKIYHFVYAEEIDIYKELTEVINV